MFCRATLLSVCYNHDNDEQNNENRAANHNIQTTSALSCLHLELSGLLAHFKSWLLDVFGLVFHVVDFLLIVDDLFKILLHFAFDLVNFCKGTVQFVIAWLAPLGQCFRADSIQMLDRVLVHKI